MKLATGRFKKILSLAMLLSIVYICGIRTVAAEQTPAQGEASTVTGVEISTTTMMYAVKEVNVRKEPNTSSEIMGKLAAGEHIFAVELTDEGWYRVVYLGETGYIRGDFLAVFENMDIWIASEPEPEPLELTDTAETAQEDTDNQLNDNDETSIEADNEDAGIQEGQTDKQTNIFSILIIVTLVVVIVVYAIIQIIKDYKKPDDNEGEDGEDKSYDIDEEGIDEYISYDIDEEGAEEDMSYDNDEEETDEDKSYDIGEEEVDEDNVYDIGEEDIEIMDLDDD
ncbi:MAG: SH3 domain-containing protein [Clostridiales bacterium]|nr:SH3 domain-containing protein [Clostridiales bacterium]